MFRASRIARSLRNPRTLCWLIALFLAESPSFAQDPPPDCVLQFRALILGTEKSSTSLPEKIEIRSSKKDSQALFSAVRALWETDVRMDEIQPIVEKIAASKFAEVTAEERAKLKAARKVSSIYRTGFQLFDQSHEAPQNLDRFVTEFGKLNDAIAARDTNVDLQKPAKKFLKATKKLERTPVFELATADRKSFAANMESSLRLIRRLAGRSNPLSSERLHELRKRLKIFLSYFQVRQAVNPDKETLAIYNELFEINEELGVLHDFSVQSELTGQAKYDDIELELTPELRHRILSFIQRVDLKR